MDVNQLMIPVYINEKIVLDMLAIIEDGFSTVSQVSYSDHKENSNAQKIEAEVSTSASKYSLQGTTQSRYLTGGVPPVRFSM